MGSSYRGAERREWKGMIRVDAWALTRSYGSWKEAEMCVDRKVTLETSAVTADRVESKA